MNKSLISRICRLSPWLLAIAAVAGCASSSVTGHQRYVYDKLPRPNNIIVYSFAASAADVPSQSAFAGQAYASSTVPTSEELEIGRELGDLIATRLVQSIQEMGLPASHGIPGGPVQVNDIEIRGYLASIEQGSTVKRMTIGFGSGGSELTTVVEGFQMTPQGLRKLGSATTGAEGSKGPGASLGAAGWIITGSPVGLIVGGGMKIYGEASGSARVEGRAKQTADEIADRLKTRFKEEGWIQ
jgi:hypothetical protein